MVLDFSVLSKFDCLCCVCDRVSCVNQDHILFCKHHKVFIDMIRKVH